MKTLVLGDIHCQFEIVEKALLTPYPLVFIGDYLDSFTRSSDEAIATLLMVMDAVEGGRAVALQGNHERSYLDPKMRCSGYKPTTQVHVDHLRGRMASTLKDYVWAEGFLISHAGVSKRLLDDLGIDLETYLESKNYDQIGYVRGGHSPVGGLYWCDWRGEFIPLDGVDQIVGHTRGSDIRQKDNSWCIDCLEDNSPKGLLIDEGIATVFNF